MERLEFLGEVCPGAAYLFDVTHRAFLWLSPRVTELLGYTPDAIGQMGANALPRIVWPADLPRVQAHYDAMLPLINGEAASYQARFRTRDGQLRVLKCQERIYRRYADVGVQALVGMAWDVTQHWQQQEQIRLQADLLQAVKQAVIAADLDGRITYWNTFAESLYGYAAAEAIGRSILDLSLGAEAGIDLAAMLRELQQNSVWRGTVPVRHRDGRVFPARITTSALHDETGRLTGLIGVSEDISAEVTSQQALEQSERRLALFSRAANDALWEWDPQTNRVWRNEAFSVLVGEPADAPEFAWWLERVHPEDRDRMLRLIHDSLAAALNYQAKYRLRRVSGEYATVLDRVYVDRSEDGTVRRVVGAITDLTPLARAEEALQEQVEHFRRVFDEAPLGIALVDPDGRMVRANPRLCELLGYSSEELAAVTFQELTHSEDLERTTHGTRQLFAGEIQRFEVEKRCFCKCGKTLWVSITGTLLRSHDGEPRWMLGMVEDITRRRADEQELRVARERAEAASAAKSAFLAQVSHEIRTPMSGLLGMLGLLAGSGLNGDQAQLLDAAQQAGQGLLRIINDILDLTKYQHGKLVIQPSPCSLAQLASELRALYRPQAESRGIWFSTVLDPNLPPWILADCGRLRQVLMNLLSNALRFTERGAVTVEIRRVVASPLAIEFSVTDTGTGIPPQALPSIFEAFNELSAETSRSIGGTGLGLAIVKQLVTLMGGTAQVQSQLGAGSRFSFVLPFQVAVAPALPSAVPCGNAKQLEGRRVLLVEDNLINQRVGQALLSGMGMEVDVAASGLDAVLQWQRRNYDVVLMDCTMPVMDGFEASRRIRALGGLGAKVPIIALTALAFEEDRQRCLDAGMSDFLAKPVDKAGLQQTLQQWL